MSALQTRTMEMVEDDGGSGELSAGRLEMQSTAELIKGLLQEGRTLLRDELYLARLEIKHEVKKARSAALALGAAAATGLAAMLALAFGLGSLLAALMPVWVAAFIVAGFLGLGAFALVVAATTTLKSVHLKPEEALGALKEDGRWIKETLRDLQSPRPGTT